MPLGTVGDHGQAPGWPLSQASSHLKLIVTTVALSYSSESAPGTVSVCVCVRVRAARFSVHCNPPRWTGLPEPACQWASTEGLCARES